MARVLFRLGLFVNQLQQVYELKRALVTLKRISLVLQIRGESCSGLQYYMSSLKLAFHFHGETVAMVMQPECPCEKHTPIGKRLTPAAPQLCSLSMAHCYTLCWISSPHQHLQADRAVTDLMTIYVNLCCSCCVHPGWLHGF